jgi:CelD/BcsL family acetyltransferase involved in cellulose biosynthesis
MPSVNLPASHIAVYTSPGLPESAWQAWSALQQSEPSYDAPSLRPEFIRLLAPLRPYLRIAVARADDRPVAFLPFVVDSHGHAYPPGQWLMSFQGPLCDPDYNIDHQAWLTACGVRQLRFDRLVMPAAPPNNCVLSTAISPVIDLSRGYSGYKQDLKARRSKLIKRVEQKRRHAERLLASVELADEAMFPDSMELLVAWRRERNREILAADFLAIPWVTDFMRVLCEQRRELFRGRLFVLRLGNQPAAALLAIQTRDVLECVVTAFNPKLSMYSPGLLLFHQLVREAVDYGITRIHLTRGTEHFKERFENEEVTVADAIYGQSAISRQAMRARLAAKHFIWRSPWGHPVRRVWRRTVRAAERISVHEQSWVDVPAVEVTSTSSHPEGALATEGSGLLPHTSSSSNQQ